MTEKQENGMLALAAGVIFILLALCLMSCSAKKVVVKDTQYVHDTLVVTHTDTLTVERWNTRQDTVRIESERVITLLQSDKSLPAETVKVVVNNDKYRYVYVGDSTLSARSVVDSLLRTLDRRHESEKLKVKKEPPWKLMLLVAAILAACVVVLRDRK